MRLGAIWDTTKEALAGAYQDLVGFAVGLVEALVVVGVAILVARGLRRRVRRYLRRTPLDGNVVALVANGSAIFIYVVAASIVFALLGASWTAVGAILGAGTVAVSLALQDVLRNVVAGLYVLLEQPFSIGDRIKVRDVEGTVEVIDIRTTALRTERDELVLVPNATIFAEVLTNRSAAGLDRTTLSLKGITVPLDAVPREVGEALAGLDEMADREPIVEIGAAGSEGAEVTVRLAHAPGTDVAPAALARLRERFPDASVSVERA